MIATPTTTVTVYADITAGIDDYGDPIPDDTPTAVGVPASILEQSQQATTGVDDRRQVVRQATVRLPDGTDVTGGSRLVDDRTFDVWIVDSTTQPSSPYLTNDIRCEAHRAT